MVSLLSYINYVILCYMAAKISSGECLKQQDLQLCEYSSPLRDMDVCLNSLRLGTELWESAFLSHFSYYRKVTGIQKYSTMPVVYTSYYRKVTGIVTAPCKRHCS